MNRISIVGALALIAAMGTGLTQANPLVPGENQLCIYDQSGAPISSWDTVCDEQITGSLDPVPSAGPGNALSSPQFFFGLPWSVYDIVTYDPGSYTVDTVEGGIYNFTVNPGQTGASMLFAWGPPSATSCGQAVCDMDIVLVWDVDFDGNTTLVSSDWDGDGIPGGAMIDGAFQGISANFDLVVEGDIRPGPPAPGVAIAIDVPGGTTQLCTDPSGCTVAFVAETALFGGAELGTIEWTINGISEGFGDTISPILLVGSYTIEALATTTTGESDTDMVSITLFDTLPPSPLPDGTRLTIGPGSTFAYASSPPAPLLEGNDGLVLGTVIPPVPGSFHVGPLDGNPGEEGGIVQSFEFFGATATFWTESSIVDFGGGLVDMSGWRGAWADEPFFSFDNPVGFLTVVGNTYQLDYDGLTIEPPPFVGMPFFLHLEGEIVLMNQAPDCSGAVASIDNIWPPNHKFVSVNIIGVTDPDSDSISITIDSIFQDEPVDSYGDGRFSPDGSGVGTTTAELRAERSGTKKVPGNGRVYHVSFTAEDGQGGACTAKVLVGVPHDRKTAPIDDGAVHDSTIP